MMVIKHSPYKAMFGCDMKVNLKSSYVASEEMFQLKGSHYGNSLIYNKFLMVKDLKKCHCKTKCGTKNVFLKLQIFGVTLNAIQVYLAITNRN